MVAILLGTSAFEAPRQLQGLQVDEGYKQLFEQIPVGVWSQVGFLVAALFGAARVWGAPVFQALSWMVPPLALIAGWLRLGRSLRLGWTR